MRTMNALATVSTLPRISAWVASSRARTARCPARICVRRRRRLRASKKIYRQPCGFGAELLLADARAQIHQGGGDAEFSGGLVGQRDGSAAGRNAEAYRRALDGNTKAIDQLE